MRGKGLAWLGIPAGDSRPARFFGETLDLEVVFDAGNTAELTAGNDDRIQLFGPGHRSFEFYRSHGASTVPLPEMDDLDQGEAEPARSGAELLSGPESDGTWTWLTFRAPDGNIHSPGACMAQLAGKKTLVERARHAADLSRHIWGCRTGRKCGDILLSRHLPADLCGQARVVPSYRFSAY